MKLLIGVVQHGYDQIQENRVTDQEIGGKKNEISQNRESEFFFEKIKSPQKSF